MADLASKNVHMQAYLSKREGKKFFPQQSGTAVGAHLSYSKQQEPTAFERGTLNPEYYKSTTTFDQARITKSSIVIGSKAPPAKNATTRHSMNATSASAN